MSDGPIVNLLGELAPPPDTRLTARQRLALEHIGRHGLVPSDELGAFLHDDRRQRGGRGHHRDERCDYCGDEGGQMGRALERKGLVQRRRANALRGLEGGWHLPGWTPTGDASNEGAKPEAPYDPASAPFPEGF